MVRLEIFVQALDGRSATLAAAQVLSPLFSQLIRLTSTAVPAPPAVEAEPPLRTAKERAGNIEDAHQVSGQQVAPAVALVDSQSVSKERPLWRRAAVGCAPPNVTELQTFLMQTACAMCNAAVTCICVSTHTTLGKMPTAYVAIRRLSMLLPLMLHLASAGGKPAS